jgi:hypothetical protein
MSDGRAILAELQAGGVADRGIDYDAVMANLASGFPFTWALRRRPRPEGVAYLSARQQQLIDELVALARAPYFPEEPPSPPVVPWERVSADLRRTTGRLLDLTFRWEAYADHAFWMCSIFLDGADHGGCNVNDDEAGPEANLAELADRLCEHSLHEEIWGGWPLCPRHPTRPLWAVVNDAGIAVWRCEVSATDEVEIGQLGLLAP